MTNIIQFKEQFMPYQVISLHDIKKRIPKFQRIQLDRWEKMGYLRKIKQGFYALTDQELNEYFLFLTANKIYSPSYLSLERALRFYNLIPEEVFQITSVSTKKTTNFETTIGNFSYRHISPRLFWAYQWIPFGKQKILIAEPEKALLDYLYLHVDLKTGNDFIEMRVNKESFFEQINIKKFHTYLAAFENKSLATRAQTFLSIIQND